MAPDRNAVSGNAASMADVRGDAVSDQEAASGNAASLGGHPEKIEKCAMNFRLALNSTKSSQKGGH